MKLKEKIQEILDADSEEKMSRFIANKILYTQLLVLEELVNTLEDNDTQKMYRELCELVAQRTNALLNEEINEKQS